MRFEFEIDELAPFAFDADQIRQSVLNLLGNALDAVVPAKGQIRLSIYNEQEMAVIRIEDNGTGVAQEIKIRIFDLYFTTKDKGTGLGLPMVHRVAVEHAGRVTLEDHPDGGSIFTMYLQMREE